MNRRRQLAPIQRKAKERKELLAKERLAGLTHGIEDEILRADGENGYGVDEDELQEAFEDADKRNHLETHSSSSVIMLQLPLFKISNYHLVLHLPMKHKLLHLIWIMMIKYKPINKS